MYGRYYLRNINTLVVQGYPGAYILSHDGVRADYVGRSDEDLRRRLHDHETDGHYSYVWFNYTASPKEAYELECQWYHHYKPADNVLHPDAPGGSYLRCPVCSFYPHKPNKGVLDSLLPSSFKHRSIFEYISESAKRNRKSGALQTMRSNSLLPLSFEQQSIFERISESAKRNRNPARQKQ